MAEHNCIKVDEISTMKADINNLKEYTTDDKAWKSRMEDKVDKILWFFLGQSGTLIVGAVVGVVVYALTR